MKKCMSIVSRTTVRQVIDDINVRLPHTYTNDSLFLWINETMKKIYKDLAIQEFYSFITSKGQELYVLPEDCSIDMINSVTISSKNKSSKEFTELRSYLPNENMKEAGYRELESIREFENIFLQNGYNTRVFNPAGQDDIGGGCGQLWYVQKWLKENL